MLIDSGASGNFIKRSFIDETRENLFNEFETTDNKHVKLADGSIITSNSIISNVDTKVQDKTVKSSFVILPQLSSGYDCILGMPYLQSADPIISFRNKTIRWPPSGNNNTSRANVSSSNEFIESNVASSLNRKSIQDEAKSNSIKRRQQNWVKSNPLQQLDNIVIESISPDLSIEPGEIFYLVTICEFSNKLSHSNDNSSTDSNIQFNELSVDDIISTLQSEEQNGLLN